MDNPVSVKNLRVYVDEFFEKLELFDDYDNRHDYKGILKACIDVFLDNETNYTAKDVYRTFFMIYQITEEDKSSRQEKENLVSQSNTLLNLVEVMEKYEENTGELIDRQRDHFIHSVNVFLLGLAIYSQNSKYRKIFRRYVRNSGYDDYYRKPDSDEMSDEEFLYRWGVAALLHDIGYPFEIIGKQLKKIINDSLKTISNSYNIGLGIDFDDFDEFNSIVKIDPYNFADDYRIKYNESKILDMYKPTHILAHKLSRDFDFDNDESEKLRKHLDLFVDYMRRNDFIDHGFFSAIMVLNSYGKIFQKFEKNTVYFFYPVVDSASAILLHNYYNKTLQKDPFNLGLLSPNTNPIAYLLILCDELQEWNRQPFGVVDKQKVHVTQLAMEIKSNKYLDVVYILKKGSVGLGFSKDKRKLIESILDVNAIFEKGIFVSSDVKPEVQEEIMRNMDIGDIQAPDILIRNIESLAERINSHYNETIQAQYDEKIAKGEEIDENLRKSIEYMETDFKNLEPEFKLSNLRQARSIPKKLDMIGCEIASIYDERKALTANDFDDKEILNLAIFEHQEWKREKEGNGWTYAEIKDRKKRETPYLVDWDELKEESQELDRQTVLIIPELLESIGLKVVRTKIRLLTYKMQQYFENEFHPLASDNYSEKKYRELPDHVQYANFKQARFIVEILNEKGYDLVDVEDRGVPIRKFGDEDLEHFAKREHYGWCALKHDLGWVYASTYDDVGMTSPNLVDWDELKDDLQENNLNTFKNLPKMCDEVGLKIVKSA